VDNNFLAGREFEDFADANRQAVAWCDKVNGIHRKHLHASARELLASERPQLVPLPLWVPDVYQLHHRIVDVEGYVNVHGARYSAPYQLIGRQLEVRETEGEIQVFQGPRRVATHAKIVGVDGRSTLPEHRPPRGQAAPAGPVEEERQLAAAAPEIATYVTALKMRAHGRGTTALRRLLRMLREYPRAPFLEAVRSAEKYGLFDLDRLERMVLRGIAKDFFPTGGEGGADD